MPRTTAPILAVLALLASGPVAAETGATECAAKPTPAEQTKCLEERIARLEAELGRLDEALPTAGLNHPGGLDALIEQKLQEALQRPRLQPLQ